MLPQPQGRAWPGPSQQGRPPPGDCCLLRATGCPVWECQAGPCGPVTPPSRSLNILPSRLVLPAAAGPAPSGPRPSRGAAEGEGAAPPSLTHDPEGELLWASPARCPRARTAPTHCTPSFWKSRGALRGAGHRLWEAHAPRNSCPCTAVLTVSQAPISEPREPEYFRQGEARSCPPAEHGPAFPCTRPGQQPEASPFLAL